jgi:hypothetical protein
VKIFLFFRNHEIGERPIGALIEKIEGLQFGPGPVEILERQDGVSPAAQVLIKAAEETIKAAARRARPVARVDNFQDVAGLLGQDPDLVVIVPAEVGPVPESGQLPESVNSGTGFLISSKSTPVPPHVTPLSISLDLRDIKLPPPLAGRPSRN